MADRLIPHAGDEPLSPAEIVARLEDEFDYVAIDAEAGRQHVGDMLATFIRLKAPNEIIEFHVKAQHEAVKILFSDDPTNDDAVLQTVAMPGGDLFFGYHSSQHQQITDELVQRCAAILGYQRVRL